MADTNYVQGQIEASKNTGFACVEAEENILRRMITRQGCAEETVNELMQGDFTNREYGMIYGAIKSLVGSKRQVDLVSVDAEMTHIYGKNNGWKPSTLVSIVEPNKFTIAKWQDIGDLIKLVRDLSVRRQAIAKLEGLVGGLRDTTKDISGVLTEIGTAADGVNSGDATWKSIGDVLIDTHTHLERRQKGEIMSITSGLKCLDRIIGGFFEEELTVIAARPSVGKSAFGVNIALAAANDGFKVGIVSCEMSAEGLGQRLLSHGAWVDGMKMRRADLDDDAWDKIAGAIAEMGNLPIRFLFDCMTVEDVVNAARKLARKGELDMLIVDYLQFMETKKTFKEERHRIGYISHSLKRLAKQSHIPVIALAQVTRQGEGVMPTMKMLRESGDIEQDADGIIFLHRPDSPSDQSVNPRDKGSLEVWREKGLQYISIGIAKQRNGAIGQTNVLFDAELMRYTEITMDEPA